MSLIDKVLEMDERERHFDQVDEAMLRKLRTDPQVIRCRDKDYVEPEPEPPVAGQDFVDEDGVEHSSHCNNHPSKKRRCACDCGAK